MSIIVLEDIGKYYGAQDIFQGLGAQISRGDRIGLIGPNGAGKSTLLRIIAGQEEPTAGRVRRARGLRIAYLPQNAMWDVQQTLYSAMLDAFTDLKTIQARLRDIESRLAGPEATDALLSEYGEWQTRFELAGGFTFEAEIGAVLQGLGFTEEDYASPIAHLSGGQRTRALLARYLLEKPDLLLLDEPTNHLDLEGVEWLEGYLQGWKGTFIVVAHDRRLLEKLVTRMWELSSGRLETYDGNYTHYARQREGRMARRRAEYQAQQELIARTQAFIQRYRAGQRAREARGRERRLERMALLERPETRPELNIQLGAAPRSGDIVLEWKDLHIGFAGPPRLELLRCPDVVVGRGERIAILGPNGAGKTTLVRTIIGEHRPLRGEVFLGANVRVAYLAQTHAGLRPDNTLLEEILSDADLTIQQARDLLGSMLFSGDEVYKRVADLSGGERSRLALAKIIIAGANLLVLDEPTNHLDLDAQEALEDALRQYAGTLLLVSHDRALVDHIATQLWVLRERELVIFRGTYSEYMTSDLAQRNRAPGYADEERRERAGEWERARREMRRRQLEERRRQERAQALEEEVHRLEQELRDLERALEMASLAGEVSELEQLGITYAERKERLEGALEEWVALTG